MEGAPTALFVSVALFIVLLCIFGVSGHLCVLVTLLCKCEWKDKPGLVLILSLTVSDTVHSFCWGLGALASLIHWHPKVLRDWLPIPIAMGWTSLCIHLVVMSVNRFVAVCFPSHFNQIFTQKTTQRIVICIWLCILATNIPFITHCCVLYYDFDGLVSTYDFNSTTIWYVQYFGTIFGTVSTTVPSVLYCCVAVKLYLWKRSNSQSEIDVSLCWQFFVILFWHLVSSAIFQTVPKIAIHNRSLFFLITITSAINFTINPLVYLTWNKTIKTAFKQMITRQNVVSVQPIANANAASQRSRQRTNRKETAV